MSSTLPALSSLSSPATGDITYAVKGNSSSEGKITFAQILALFNLSVSGVVSTLGGSSKVVLLKGTSISALDPIGGQPIFDGDATGFSISVPLSESLRLIDDSEPLPIVITNVDLGISYTRTDSASVEAPDPSLGFIGQHLTLLNLGSTAFTLTGPAAGTFFNGSAGIVNTLTIAIGETVYMMSNNNAAGTSVIWQVVSRFTASAGGDVVGPGSAVDGDLALFNGTTGKLLKSGGASTAVGSGSIVRATAPTISALSTTGITTSAGASVNTANALGALAIDVTKGLNTKSISVDSVFTFSGTPATAQTFFSLLVANTDTASHVLTIPSSFSMVQEVAITSITIPASGKLLLQWQYDGSVYNLFGDPAPSNGTGPLARSAGTLAVASGKTLTATESTTLNRQSSTGLPVEFYLACSDMTTPIAAANNLAYFRAPYAFTITEVRASLDAAQTSGSIFTVDINKNGTTVLSTLLTIDNNEKTSQTAATPPVISVSSVADDDVISVDLDQSTTGATFPAGLVVLIKGYR